MATKAKSKAYDEGYKAFKKGKAVTSCKYLADVNGQQDGTIYSWMTGWQDSFNDFLGGFVNE